MITVDQLSYRIQEAHVLRNLSLRIARGSFYALAGVNGAGKSTLIKIMLDLLRNIDSGQILINGKNIKLTDSRRCLSYLPEKFDVRKEVTGWQYLSFVCGIYKHPMDKAHVIDMCEQMSLSSVRLNDIVGSYSKGMRQKLGLISCFMLDTPLIVLDEPLTGLDPKARFEFKQLLSGERKKKRTIFYSTHMLADAEEICNRFGILHQGRIVFDGTPLECIDRYQTKTLEQAYMRCITESESGTAADQSV